MQCKRPVDHVEKESDVPGAGGFPIQIEEDATDQFDPRGKSRKRLSHPQ